MSFYNYVVVYSEKGKNKSKFVIWLIKVYIAKERKTDESLEKLKNSSFFKEINS